MKLLATALVASVSFVSGWVVPFPQSQLRSTASPLQMAAGKGFGKQKEEEDPIKGMSEERKANLFQHLLRDLQIEEVPLLQVDADQVHSMQAALWTIMSQMSSNEDTELSAPKVCVILESVPLEALRLFVDDFMILKTQQPRLMDSLPELDRFTLSLVGKGVGPAIILEMTGDNTDEDSVSASGKEQELMESFLRKASETLAPPTGLSEQERKAVSYQVCTSADACQILSTYWNAVCEILTQKDVTASVVMLPGLTNHDDWKVRAELLSRSLCLYRGDAVLELEHIHPDYNRGEIYPTEKPAHGHVPPSNYLTAMLEEASIEISDTDLVNSANNAQRQGPLPAVVIRRVESWETLVDAHNGMVELEVAGKKVPASCVTAYSSNLQSLSENLNALK